MSWILKSTDVVLLSGRRMRQAGGYIFSKSSSSIIVPESIVRRAPRRGTGTDSGIRYLYFMTVRGSYRQRLGSMYTHDEYRIGSRW